MYKLKRLERHSLEAALQKAGVYRDLNQPEEAESICRDILDVDPDNQDALRILGLALTDLLSAPGARWVGMFERALEVLEKLKNDYERVYHTGVAWERSAKGHLERGEFHSALGGFERALELFEKAEKLGPVNAPEPILRWNRCVRLLNSHPELGRALDGPDERSSHLGD